MGNTRKRFEKAATQKTIRRISLPPERPVIPFGGARNDTTINSQHHYRQPVLPGSTREAIALDPVEWRKIGLTSSEATIWAGASLACKYLQWVLGLTVPSVPRSRLANLDGGFEYGTDREYASQFMCSNSC
jgi:hypothetical protein